MKGFITRDNEGNVDSWSKHPREGAVEADSNDADVQDFLNPSIQKTYREKRLEDIAELSPENTAIAAMGDSIDPLYQAMLSVLDPITYPPSVYTRDFLTRVQQVKAIKEKYPKE